MFNLFSTVPPQPTEQKCEECGGMFAIEKMKRVIVVHVDDASHNTEQLYCITHAKPYDKVYYKYADGEREYYQCIPEKEVRVNENGTPYGTTKSPVIHTPS